MREDMNKYNTSANRIPSQRTEGELSQSAGATARTMGGMVWKIVKTLFWVCLVTGVLVFLSVMSVILSFRNTDPPNITDMSLNYSSTVYVQDENGQETQHLTLYSSEDRKWVSLSEIPQTMQSAQIAIEDHRFYEHKGVDWKGTLGAVYKLFTNSGGGGGSTLTQQLIKNITEQNQVSILRKIREIFMALNLESGYTDSQGNYHTGYSKEEILQAYLNVVNYGGQCQGVQAAANHYFDKDISQCSVAECALIAGITQNPYQFNPMLFPENAKERAAVVLDRWHELSNGGEGSEDFVNENLMKLSDDEYEQALKELETMTFVGADIGDGTEEDQKNDTEEWNWYDDLMFEDVVADLQTLNGGMSYDRAVDLMYNAGYKIVSAQNLTLQEDVENYFLTNQEMLPSDEAIELGFYMMDPYTGKVMAVVGSRGEKRGRRVFSNATDAKRQSGSSIKPISPYIVGLMSGEITYGTVLKDEPFPETEIYGENYPRNFSGDYSKTMNVDLAIEKSQNAPAAWLCREVTPEACYEWLTTKLHFTSLTEEDSHSIAAMSLGGQTDGVTVEEMTAAFQIYANGGVYNKPITYLYVEDHDGNVILDNREYVGEQVMTLEEATVMNKLLHGPIYGWANNEATAWQVSDLPVEIYGKTGTTDSGNDLWFVGATPFCVAGIWNGYEYPSELEDSTTAKITWKAVIQHLIDNYDWSGKSWVLSDQIEEHTFCRDSGKLAGEHCYNTAKGYYVSGKVPDLCNGGSDHISGTVSPSASPSLEPSDSPSISPSPEVSASPDSGVSSEEETSSPVSSGPESSEPVSEAPTLEPPPGPEETSTPEPGTSSAVTFMPDVPADDLTPAG